MKRHFLFSAALALTLAANAQQWPEPRQEAKPGTRWWWLGSAVNEKGLEWNLRQYADHGIGAVEITPIYGVQGNEANNIPFLSPRYMEILRFVNAQCQKNGIELDMATGTGWPFGGPWVPLEESASQMVIVDTTVVGRKLKSLPLLPPEKKRKNSSLIAVYAFADGKFVRVETPLVDGTLTAKLPKSATWRIIALYQKMGVMAVKRAAPGGAGLVVDHFDKQSVMNYLKHIEEAFETTGTPYPHTFFNDSYEVSEADYTPTLFAEFEKRRGYSLEEMFDKLVDGDTKVVADYRETLSDMLLENFTKTWTAWAHSHGAITRNQAHGSPANLIDCYAAVDIPEIEGFGLTDFGIRGLRKDPGKTRRNDSDFSMLKYAPSAAHIMGKPFTSSETFTWLTEHFRTSLSQMKPDMDLMFCAGVNRMFFHGTTYSPQDDPWPGWRFYASVDMSPNNTIWRDAPYFMKYVERCQSMLQWGQPDNDFLTYLPIHDMWAQRSKSKRLMQFSIHAMGKLAPEFVSCIDKIESAGFDCDYISDRLLLSTTYKNGRLITEGGTSYKAIVIPDQANILTPEVKAHIESLRAQGAKILVGTDAETLATAAKPEAMKTKLGLRLIRRSNDRGYHYFIANLTPDDVTERTTLAVPFKEAMWLDPMTGRRERAEIKDGSLLISLRSGESIFLQTFNEVTPAISGELAQLPVRGCQIETAETVVEPTAWTLSFTECTPANDKVYPLGQPQPWENLDLTTATLMGTGVYTAKFNIQPSLLKEGTDWTIDLGDVRESARVYINDSLVGCAWAVPYTLRFSSSLLKIKDNTLRVEVTNLPANRIAQLDRDGVKWRKFDEINVVDINYKKTTYADWLPVPSGLNSKVRIYSLTPNPSPTERGVISLKKKQNTK